MYPEHKKYQFMALVYRKATKIVFGQCQNSSSVNYCQIEATGWPKKLDDIRGRLFHTQFWPQKSNRIIFKICPYSRRKSIMMTGLLYIFCSNETSLIKVFFQKVNLTAMWSSSLKMRRDLPKSRRKFSTKNPTAYHVRPDTPRLSKPG